MIWEYPLNILNIILIKKKLDIDIINYKFFSGRYKIGEKNGKGQEFYGSNDELSFKGEYENGKRNGKGKEYIYDERNPIKILIFEGEYKDGIRNGKGKEYLFNKILFEGEYRNVLDGLGLNMIMKEILQKK